MPNLLLIHGLKYSGKSTIADHLISEHGYTRVKMAGPLKNMVRSLLHDAGINPEKIERYIEGDLKEVPIPELGGTTSRRLMETLGEDWRNMHGFTLWVNIAAAKIDQLHAEGKKVVVDDIRYGFEIQNLCRFNPYKWVVTRGNLHFQDYDETRPASERPLPLSWFDAHVQNDTDDRRNVWDLADSLLSVKAQFEHNITELTKRQPKYNGEIEDLGIAA